jgi:tetratricopeptide (TPR) repeat protein
MSWWDKLTTKTRGVYGGAKLPEGACDHGAISLRQGTAEFEWFVARSELELNRDLKHGAGHLANLLSYDPGHPEWIELLEGYLAKAGPDPETLIPRGEKLYYSTEAMRAYLWHKKGRLADAVNLLVNAVQAKQDSRYLEAWALGWLEPPGAVESLPEPVGLHLFGLVLNRCPEARMLPVRRLRELQRWARLMERFAQKHPGEGMTTMLRAGLFRKAGMFAEAEAIVRAALQKSPNWHTATALGLVLRQKGDVAEAEKAFQLALKLDPDDVSARLEAGDTFFEREQWQPALGWYENAVAKEKGQPWAVPSALFCRWKLTHDERHIRELVELAKQGNDRARHLFNEEFYGGIPEPHDATANLLRQFRDTIVKDPKNAPTGEAQMAVTSLEAPSNFLAFRMEMAALKHDLRLTVTVNSIAKPDPRNPYEEVKYMLWKYDGTNALPNLPAPSADVVNRIAALAVQRYDDWANWAAASCIAEEVGPERVGEVLAAMVHPPPVPKGHSALSWLPRVQHAAAQVAAQVDEGWEDSARREALLSVLFGPSDWATNAAIRALARIGRENEPFAPDIHDAFQHLADCRPDSGYCCWERTLFSEWLGLPHLYPDERKALQKTLQEVDARGKDKEK